MNNQTPLYRDFVIEVKIVSDDTNEQLKSIALRYVNPIYKDRSGNDVLGTNAMGGETDWFILPHTFGAAIGKKLFEQYNAGLDGFERSEVETLKKWLIDMEVINAGMVY
jgi:hypothetical protein